MGSLQSPAPLTLASDGEAYASSIIRTVQNSTSLPFAPTFEELRAGGDVPFRRLRQIRDTSRAYPGSGGQDALSDFERERRIRGY